MRAKTFPTPVRVLLRITAVLLSIVLFAGLIAGAMLLDLRLMLGHQGVQAITDALLLPREERSIPDGIPAVKASAATEPNYGESPLAEFFWQGLQEAYGEELPMTRQELDVFLQKSTLDDFLSEKLAAYTSDFIMGTHEATFTDEEILAVLDDNAELFYQEFGVELTPELKQQALEIVRGYDFDSIIREKVMQEVGNEPLITLGDSVYTVEDALSALRFLTSDKVLWTVLIALVVVMVLIVLANCLRPRGSLLHIGIPMTVAGVCLVLAAAALTLGAGVLPAEAAQTAAAVSGVVAPVHYGCPVLGVVITVSAFFFKKK